MTLFITGTGTGVGKTLVTAGLAAWLHAQGQSVCVYKPLQTGSPDAQRPEDPETVKWLAGKHIATACSYCFPMPASPYAADPGHTVESYRLQQDFDALQTKYDVVLVEGAGGVRVPIAPHFEMTDLMKQLALPVLIVTTPALGSLNHTLLTVEALQNRNIPVAGIVVSTAGMAYTSETDVDPAANSFIETLTPFLDARLLGVLPHYSVVSGLFDSTQNDTRLTLSAFARIGRRLFPGAARPITATGNRKH